MQDIFIPKEAPCGGRFELIHEGNYYLTSPQMYNGYQPQLVVLHA